LEKSKNDTLGLDAFYKKHLNNYRWKNRMDVLIASSTKSDYINKAQKLLKQNKSAADIKAKLNSKDAVEIMLNEGVFEEGNAILPKNIKAEVGVTEPIKKDEYFYVAKVIKVLPEAPKTLEECKGKVINDYQQFLEENWVSDLKKEFKIEVNKPVFEKVKKEIKL
jgi:peptidyl-prolyl cis-trans isomerase SurA